MRDYFWIRAPVRKPLSNLKSPIIIWSLMSYCFRILDSANKKFIKFKISACPVGWGCRIHRLHLCRGVTSHQKSVLNMTLNNRIVRLQPWSFRKYDVPLHCHYSQVHSDPERVALGRFLSLVSWGCRIHRLHLCRGVRYHQRVSWIWY